MTPYPLLFEPIFKPRVWGGRRLERLGKALPVNEMIGESWELADLPPAVEGGRSVVANGPDAGRTLHDLLERSPQAILGATPPADDGGFPLLIKYLDARENLSVQVHPSPAYARRHPGTRPKSEAWYVLHAEPGAVIYQGLHPDVDRARFLEHVRAGTLDQALRVVPARAGECHHVPSGDCHALGAGVLVAEIQTPSDTTFRLFDWGRDGRELHVEQAIQCIQFSQPAPPAPPAPPPPFVTAGSTTFPILRTAHFVLERFDAEARATLPVVTNGIPEIWMVLAGMARIRMSGGFAVDISLGDTALLPAGLPEAHAAFPTPTTVLRVTPPSPLEGLIA